METILYDNKGYAVAYIRDEIDRAIITWDGYAVCYLYNEAVYGWNGQHIGWFIGGVLYDLSGKQVGYTNLTCPVSIKGLPPLSVMKPLRSLSTMRPLHPLPYLSMINATISLKDFLMKGAK